TFLGSTGALKLNQPVVGISGGGRGYRLVAGDGGIFAFGDATFAGSPAATGSGPSVVAIAASGR
ncbi:MAG: hypothetical protein ACRDY5_07990, partial [Acidimicrobiales bacterium]